MGGTSELVGNAGEGMPDLPGSARSAAGGRSRGFDTYRRLVRFVDRDHRAGLDRAGHP